MGNWTGRPELVAAPFRATFGGLAGGDEANAVVSEVTANVRLRRAHQRRRRAVGKRKMVARKWKEANKLGFDSRYRVESVENCISLLSHVYKYTQMSLWVHYLVS